MPAITPLPSRLLHATFDHNRIPWNDSREIPATRHAKNGRSPFQPRAMQALDLALRIKNAGYHVYLSGEADLGRSYMLLSYLKPEAAKGETPPDLIYVQNFANKDCPKLISLPHGQGIKFKEGLRELVASISQALEKRLDTLNFSRQRARLMEQFHSARSDLLKKMNEMAVEKGFSLDFDDNGGLALSPLKDGKKDEAPMTTEVKMDLKRRGDRLAKNLVVLMRQLNKAEETFHDDERMLEAEAMTETLDAIFTPFEQKTLKSCPETRDYLKDLRNDIQENTQSFLPRDVGIKNDEPHQSIATDNFLERYAINLFVDNSCTQGMPIIVEDNPCAANLLGCIERESEMGALVTDFSLIRAGSLQKANGGFLVIHVEDLLQHPLAWDGLLRSLRSARSKIEDGMDSPDTAIRTKGLDPDPLALNLKVILIGGEDFYEDLLLDDRFAKLFRIKAHMTDQTERTAQNVRHYLAQIAQIIREGDLPPFNARALAWLVDLGSHICEDQKRLSLKFPLLRDIMIEASALAAMKEKDIVDGEILEESYANRTYRANLLEDVFMEDYDRQTIKVETSGKAIGQVNGLSITMNGDFEFGLPHRISCTVGVGHEGIIDLEREAELGGPIHTKAMMILKSYLTSMFARKKPLVLSASLYFEQSYAGIEGDSASGAELAALLSALAEVPVRLDLAFTGAVSHSGQIMAVGGVTRKIEGFYKVCARHGLTGKQGVIIPYDNIDHLMLSPEILESVDKGIFYIYSVKNIEEALFLLTGMPAGKRRKDGTFTPKSLYDIVDRRLESLGCFAQNAFRRQRKDA